MDKEWKKVLDDGTEVIRTCAWSPPGCHPVGCGLKLYVKDGKLVKAEGDEDHPITNGRLCVRCLTLPEYIYNEDRVTHPLKRAKEDRGKDKWERITWDEAYSIIKEETDKIIEKYGREGIVYFGGTGRMSTIEGTIMTEMALGTPNGCYAQSGWSCYGPRRAACSYMAGAGIIDIDWAGPFPDRYDHEGWELPKYVLLWGKDPLASNPDGMFGHSIIDMMKRGTKIIMADPRMNWLACHAEYVMRLRPGTDVALLMGLLNVIVSEDLYDHDFCDRWVYGWEEFSARVLEHSVEWAAETSGVSEEMIRSVGRILGTVKPISCGWGLAVDQATNGVQIAQCIMALTAITGNLDVPGGTPLGYSIKGVRTAAMATMALFSPDGKEKGLSPEMQAKRIGSKEYPGCTSILPTAHPDMMLECLETDEPYPIRMAWIGSSNVIAPTCSAQPKRWHKALQKMEFVVITDIFHNPMSMAFADIFLPISSFAAQDAFVLTNYGSNVAFVGAINKAIDEGECKSEYQIGFDMIQLFNPEANLWKNHEEFLDWAFDGDIKFNDLREMGVWQPGFEYKKYERGLLRPDGQPGFNTATGRLELYTLKYQQFGEDPLPYYIEPHYSPVSTPELFEEYPLIMTSGSRYYTSFHSEHRQVPTLRKLHPDPLCEIHPETAAALGIKEGDWIWIENMFGKCKERAKLTQAVKKDTVNAQHGFWFPDEDPEEPHLFGNWKSNINELVPHREIGKLGFGAPYKSLICKVYLAEDGLAEE